MAIWPEVKMNPLALMACEYGPIAWGASLVEMISRIGSFSAPGKTTPQRAQGNTEERMLCLSGELGIKEPALDFLQSLHFMHSGDLSQAHNNGLQVLQVRDVENDFHARLTVCGLSGDVADVAFGVADHPRDVFQHAEAVIAVDRQFYRICRGRCVIAGPLDVNLALRLVEKICDVRTIHGMHGDAFAARDVSHDALTANGITTAGAVDEHVSLATDRDGVVVSEDAADD